MRNFKKALALATSVAAICTSASAFAEVAYEVTGLNGSYDAANNALTLTVDGAAGDKTVLVLANGVADTAATGDDILYINQYTADEAAFSAMGLKGTDALAVGEYAVKIGYEDANGDFTIANGKIVVTEAAAGGTEVKVVYGDVTADAAANAQDAAAILSAAIGGPVKAGASEYEIGQKLGTIVYGDVTADAAANAQDAAAILSAAIGGPVKAGASEYEIGSTVTVVVE